MGKVKSSQRIILALLVSALLMTVMPSVRAAEYPVDQYYKAADGGVEVYTVQFSAGENWDGAVAARDKMLARGYDAFLYQADEVYRIMAGKFRKENYADAKAYRDAIREVPGRENAYLTRVYLPDWAIEEFEAVYYGGSTGAEASEQATGPFFCEEESGKTYYTVQFSAGTSFASAEAVRDKMTQQGFYAFVYKKDLTYRIMAGVFTDKKDAQDYCRRIQTETTRTKAYVARAKLPQSALEDFQNFG